MAIKRISAYNANRLLDYEFSDGVWLSVHDDDPTDAGLNEIAGADRVFVPADDWSTAASKALHNTEEILLVDMPECEIHYLGAWDAETSGNFLRATPRETGSPLTLTPLAVPAGSTLRLQAETCVFRISNVS